MTFSDHFSILVLLAVALLAFMGLWWVRIEVVYRARSKQIDICHRRGMDDLDRWHEASMLAVKQGRRRLLPPGSPFEAFDQSPTFGEQMWQLTKWTHAQFYPSDATK